MKRTIGVCYCPEHWPEDIWATNAQRMAEAGLSWVRIGEFAWSCMEPKPGHFEWDWLDQAIETLGAAGLKVILGTPTATTLDARQASVKSKMKSLGDDQLEAILAALKRKHEPIEDMVAFFTRRCGRHLQPSLEQLIQWPSIRLSIQILFSKNLMDQK